MLYQILHASEHEGVIEEVIGDADWICCLDPVCGRWRHVTKNILDAYEHTFECSFLAPAVCEDSCDWCQVIDNPSCDSVGYLADGMAVAANMRQQRRQDEIECQHVG